MNIYINGLGNVSPQVTTDNADFLTEPVNKQDTSFACIDPDYKSILQKANLRRMSRLIKFGMYSAQQCLIDSKVENLDAIITGTGLGCLKDTEKFLIDIYGNDEGVLSPTKFMQSTHNTLSGQIALMLNCEQYNFTYVHRGASFESALLDGIMLIEEEANNILVGGLDELTDTYLAVTKRMKMWRRDAISQLDLFSNKQSGSIAGEGASFFMLSKEQSSTSYAKIKGLKILFKPKSIETIYGEMQALIQDAGLEMGAIDVVVLGMNGDQEQDKLYDELIERYFQDKQLTAFKHLCGEYKTASAFGLWTAAQMLGKQNIPEVLKLNKSASPILKNVLVYNCYNNSNHSLLLLQDVNA